MMSKPVQLLRTALYLVLGVYALCFVGLAFRMGPSDSDLMATYYETAWRFWTSAHSFLPQFNPLLEGGRPLGADPQIPVFHPFTLLVPILGAPIVVKWEMALQVAVALWGLTRLFQYLGFSTAQRLWGTLVYFAGGGLVSRCLVSHITLGSLLLTPCFIFLGLRLSDLPLESWARWRYRFMYWALWIYCGLYKPHLFINVAPFLLLEALLRSAVQKRWSPILETGFAFTTSVFANAFIYLPAQWYFFHFPRTEGAEPLWISPSVLIANLLLPLRTIPKALLGVKFLQRHELNYFIGPIALYFAFLGWRKWKDSSAIPFLALAVLGAWLGFGAPTADWHPAWLFSWLRPLWPGMETNRVPPRFWFFTYFALVVFSAKGFQWPVKKSSRALIISLGVLPLILSATINLFKVPLEGAYTFWNLPQGYQGQWIWEDNHPNQSYPILRKGFGALGTHQNVEVERSSLVIPGPHLGTTASAPFSGRLTSLTWNRILVNLRGEDPFTVSLNLNASPLWRFEGTGEKVEARGLPLTLASDGNTLSGFLIYELPRLQEGFWISGVFWAFLLSLGIWKFFRRPKFKTVGLTGGIASGKSLVGSFLKEKGVPVLDLDKIGHEVLTSDKDASQEIHRTFGEKVFSDGEIDRKKLRDHVFSNPEDRTHLEKILHPKILARFHFQRQTLRKEGHSLVVCEAALLIESGFYRELDELVVVTCPKEVRIQRLCQRDGITVEAAEKILASQTDDERRQALATYLLKNENDIQSLKEKTLALFRNKFLLPALKTGS